MGDEQARTPHIDRLASEGVIMDNTFANTPVCCPARSILLTGQYCHRNGMVANDLIAERDQVTAFHRPPSATAAKRPADTLASCRHIGVPS